MAVRTSVESPPAASTSSPTVMGKVMSLLLRWGM
jgi:hypothetical protein